MVTRVITSRPHLRYCVFQEESRSIHQVGFVLIESLFFLAAFLSLLTYLGNVYIADTNNHRIRKVTVSTGIITTYAGTGTITYSGDNGPATSAGLNTPSGVSLDSAGIRLQTYCLSFENYLIKLI